MMNIQDFGDALIRTNDLDPVYIGLVGMQLPPSQLDRWLLSYWCFYNIGSACWLSEQEGEMFWGNLTTAARNTTPPPIHWGGRWPRAAERRHFRGGKCVSAIHYLWDIYRTPEAPVASLRHCTTATEVMSQVQTWPMFGPWAAFKAADMLERCAGVPLTFPPDIGLIYKEPRAGLDLAAAQEGIGVHDLYDQLTHHFSRTPAPPSYDRPCGPTEIETVACKHKSYMNGHYPIGKDITETRHALAGWGATATRMLTHMPKEAEEHA